MKCLMLGLCLSVGSLWGGVQTSRLTILSINDVYEIVEDSTGRGGFAELQTMLNQERANAEHVLVTVNGDFLSPSVLSIFDKGAHRVDLFNLLGVDLVCIGNHEFDFGPAAMLERVRESKFPWLAANAVGHDGLPFTNTPQTFVVDIDGIKVGFFGLITTETPFLSSTEKLVCFTPLARTAREMIAQLKEQGADVIVALTHLFFNEDKRLAEEVPEIDIILGGHDHDPMTWYNDRTFLHKSGQNAYYLVRIDLEIVKDEETGKVKVYPEWNMLINRGYDRDPVIAQKVDALQAQLDVIAAHPIVELGTSFNTLYTEVRAQESEMGNLVADAVKNFCHADVAIITGGTIRGNRFYQVGQCLTLRDIVTELPFVNWNVVVEVPGCILWEALENGVSQVEGKAGRFPQVSGMNFYYDMDAPPGKRVQKVFVAGELLVPERLYKVAMVDYMFHGGDGYTMFKEGNVLLPPSEKVDLVACVAQYLASLGKVESSLEGRIIGFREADILDYSR